MSTNLGIIILENNPDGFRRYIDFYLLFGNFHICFKFTTFGFKLEDMIVLTFRFNCEVEFIDYVSSLAQTVF